MRRRPCRRRLARQNGARTRATRRISVCYLYESPRFPAVRPNFRETFPGTGQFIDPGKHDVEKFGGKFGKANVKINLRSSDDGCTLLRLIREESLESGKLPFHFSLFFFFSSLPFLSSGGEIEAGSPRDPYNARDSPCRSFNISKWPRTIYLRAILEIY